ncbi:MAG TPA: hypothetical protein VGZ03_11555 [Acidimicrobiales bacterium]|nr:hypothetical protein [Acidimicrobiales bacterium]
MQKGVKEFGSFLRGALMGIEVKGNRTQLRVRTVDSEAGWTDRIGYRRFDSLTGEKQLPDGLRVGDLVECKVFTKARRYRADDGTQAAFVTYDLISLEVLVAAPVTAELVEVPAVASA